MVEPFICKPFCLFVFFEKKYCFDRWCHCIQVAYFNLCSLSTDGDGELSSGFLGPWVCSGCFEFNFLGSDTKRIGS